jgi:probable addiction module antidote protein
MRLRSSGAIMKNKKSRSFQAVLLERLANAEVAKHYLNEALEESPEAFLNALKTVAQARQMAKVAKDAGVQRETLYRSLSSQGNPTLGTLSSILKAVGLKISIGIEGAEETVSPTRAPSPIQIFPQPPLAANATTEYSNTTEVRPGSADAYPSLFGDGNAWTGNGAFQNAACIHC